MDEKTIKYERKRIEEWKEIGVMKGNKGRKSKIRDKKERKEEKTAKEGKRERSNKDQRLNGHKHSDCFKVNPSICKNKTQTNARTAPPFENKHEFYLLVCLF